VAPTTRLEVWEHLLWSVKPAPAEAAAESPVVAVPVVRPAEADLVRLADLLNGPRRWPSSAASAAPVRTTTWWRWPRSFRPQPPLPAAVLVWQGGLGVRLAQVLVSAAGMDGGEKTRSRRRLATPSSITIVRWPDLGSITTLSV
jgi:hypothetical protein